MRRWRWWATIFKPSNPQTMWKGRSSIWLTEECIIQIRGCFDPMKIIKHLGNNYMAKEIKFCQQLFYIKNANFFSLLLCKIDETDRNNM